MKQEVHVTLKLKLWLPCKFNKEEITTFFRHRLPNAFGNYLTDMINPIDIIDIKEEQEIYETN